GFVFGTERQGQHRPDGPVHAAKIAGGALIEVAEVGDGCRDQGMRHLQEDGASPAEKDNTLAIDLAGDRIHPALIVALSPRLRSTPRIIRSRGACMERRRLGSSGLEISRIGLGTWAIGGHMWGGQDDVLSVQAIHAAVDHGVNWIDTAPIYGSGHS